MGRLIAAFFCSRPFIKIHVMKKISLFLLTSGVISISFAQNQTQPQLTTPTSVQTRIGIKGGVNLATLEIDDQSTPDMNTEMKPRFMEAYL